MNIESAYIPSIAGRKVIVLVLLNRAQVSVHSKTLNTKAEGFQSSVL